MHKYNIFTAPHNSPSLAHLIPSCILNATLVNPLSPSCPVINNFFPLFAFAPVSSDPAALTPVVGLVVSATPIEHQNSQIRSIEGSKYFQSPHMRVFSIDMIRNNQDLEVIAWDWWSILSPLIFPSSISLVKTYPSSTSAPSPESAFMGLSGI